MNPAGISMFYGALDVDTAAAEVYDGERYAAVAAFESFRPLDVVDLSDLPSASVFNPADAQRVHFVGFLRGFAREVSRPIVRDDTVHVEYTPTQVFTEYLRFKVPLPDAPVDGIIFPSSRLPGGRNIVLFIGHDACLNDEQRTGDSPREEVQVLKLRDEACDEYEYGAPPSEFRRTRGFAPHTIISESPPL